MACNAIKNTVFNLIHFFPIASFEISNNNNDKSVINNNDKCYLLSQYTKSAFLITLSCWSALKVWHFKQGIILFSLWNPSNQHNQVVINIYIRWLSKSELILLSWIHSLFLYVIPQHLMCMRKTSFKVLGVISLEHMTHSLAFRTVIQYREQKS